MDPVIAILFGIGLIGFSIAASVYFNNQKENGNELIEEIGNSLNEEGTDIEVSFKAANGTRLKIRRGTGGRKRPDPKKEKDDDGDEVAGV